jgi:hypothetical protein
MWNDVIRETDIDFDSVCRLYPEYPFTPPPRGNCPSCKAREQFADEACSIVNDQPMHHSTPTASNS